MADQTTTETAPFNIELVITDILDTITHEREREIIARRFGLFDRKETLEQIGELLGITRERVRQLEKSVITRLKSTAQELPHISDIEVVIVTEVDKLGMAGRISDLTANIAPENGKIDQARISFLSHLCPALAVIEENDTFHHAVGLTRVHNELAMKELVEKITTVIKKAGEPTSIDHIAGEVRNGTTEHVRALASISKQLAHLNGRWGLVKWPMVNPKNIRDKIYVILFEHGKPMHFNEIAEAIKASAFKRKDVTTQAIHNELIKDSRFVLIGRGIYALKEWGYSKGTVADIITKVLKDAGTPLHRDEIVQRVLKSRRVKETTILLNLQGKPQFKRVAKATYALAEQ
jgi:predicted Zn-ribbon and HTH transcriptional regulator